MKATKRLTRVIALAAAMFISVTAHAQRPMRVPLAESLADSIKADTTARITRPRIFVGTFDGLVTDTTLAPIAEAEVTVLRTSLKVRTGANGRFRITNMPAGQYLIIVRRLGYHPTSGVVAVPPNDTLRLSYALTRAPQGLDTVRVVTERRSFKMMEFEDRRKFGEGQFLTQDQIDKHNSVFVSDLLRFFFRGVTVLEAVGGVGAGGQVQEFATSSRGYGGVETLGSSADPKTQVVVPTRCYMKVIVDEVAMPTPFDLALLPSPREIAGIELYTGPATIPVRFNGLDSRCGLILIWTKDGS
jgi:hypothetical protein